MTTMNITDVADLRTDVLKIHEDLTAKKQEAQGIVGMLDTELSDLPEEPQHEDYRALLQDTRNLAATVFHRLEHGDSNLQPSADADSEASEVEVTEE